MNNGSINEQCPYLPDNVKKLMVGEKPVYFMEDSADLGKYYVCTQIDDDVKGENKMKLLEIYEDNQKEKIYNEYATKIEKVRATDPRYKEILDFKKKFEKEVVVYDDQYKFNDVIARKVHDLTNQRQKAIDNLYQTIREIRAQLDLCETYEQAMTVLRNYNVVDENYVLIK